VVNLKACIEQFGFKHEKTFHGSAPDSRNTYRLREYLLKNGIDDLQFIKKSKTIVKKAKPYDTSDDSCMDDVFNFNREEDEDLDNAGPDNDG
jgi:hypothetical protein